MKRAEQLSAKYKTLSYDQERLLEQHRSAKEAAAQAEREMEAGKAKIEAVQRKLAEEEDSHKKSKEDLHKVKLAMQGSRIAGTSRRIVRKPKALTKLRSKLSAVKKTLLFARDIVEAISLAACNRQLRRL